MLVYALPVGTAGQEKRRFRRMASDTSVFYRGYRVDRPTRAYLEGIAHNVSLGGLFLLTDRPPPKGVVLDLSFGRPHSDNSSQPIPAKAIVRWRRRWRKPRGVGIEFIEIEGVERDKIHQWVASISSDTIVD